MNVILSAGWATRQPYAPHGCKALTPFLGRPMVEWQLDVLGSATIVCRSQHASLLAPYGPVVVCDGGGGPANALRSVAAATTVVYADSWFDSLPSGDDWVGVGDGKPGRRWDVVAGGKVAYRAVSQPATVCVGVYRFADGEWLRAALDDAWENRTGEVGMGEVVNRHPDPRFVPVPSWRDVGDPDALREAEQPFTLLGGALFGRRPA